MKTERCVGRVRTRTRRRPGGRWRVTELVRLSACVLCAAAGAWTCEARANRHFTVSEREIFVDHSRNGRSGHMGHALVDAGGGRILDFYSNCNGRRCDGHSGDGWMEYRVSDDYGRTFGPAKTLDYSRRVHDAWQHTALCEKAVRDPQGRILLFFQITDATKPACCEPWSEPTVAVSTDRGETFSDGIGTGADPGRIYDAVCDGKDVYFITQANDASKSFLGNASNHLYKVWKGNVGSFVPSVLPIDATGKGYGALCFAKDGSLIAYVYDSKREEDPEYTVSRDRGRTWSAPRRAHVAKKIRNPQLRRVGDTWLLAGRNGGEGDGFVLYASSDGIHWDDGEMLDRRPPGGGVGYYGNMLPIYEPGQVPRVLLQYSHVYEKCRVNIAHRTIRFDGAPKVRP